MPQGPAELHEYWESKSDKGGDDAAMTHLLDNRGFRCRNGIILQPKGHVNSEEDNSAIDYLCMEWDYGYEPYKESTDATR